MDVIILAAGENVRLQAAGLPPGMKPLMIVEGEVLIRRLCRQARSLSNGDITVVCSPTNVQEVIFATGDYASHYVVQPTPISPCDAVDRAISLGTSDDVMLLMGDNFIDSMPPIPNGRTPIVCVKREGPTTTHDIALHPVTASGRFIKNYPAMDTRFRWLGPIAFPKAMWRRGEKDWEAAFADVTFTLWAMDTRNVRDMGTMEALR